MVSRKNKMYADLTLSLESREVILNQPSTTTLLLYLDQQRPSSFIQNNDDPPPLSGPTTTLLLYPDLKDRQCERSHAIT